MARRKIAVPQRPTVLTRSAARKAYQPEDDDVAGDEASDSGLPDYDEENNEEHIAAERKQRYTLYQHRFRQDEGAIELDWDFKSLDEREAVDRALLAILGAEFDERECEKHARERQRLNDLLAAGIKDYPVFERDIRRFLPALEEWAGVTKQLEESFRALSELEAHQAAVRNEDSIKHADARAAEWLAVHTALAQEIAEMRTEIHEQKRQVPVDARGRHRIPAGWNLKHESAKRRAVHAIRQEGDQGRVGLLNDRGAVEWVPWQQFQDAERAMSEGWLWIAFNEHGRVQDRVFRKDVFLDRPDWYDVRQHDGDSRDPDSRTPNETACHNAMLGVNGLDYVPRLREGARRDLIDQDAMKFRMYIEWCQNRDLGDLIDSFARDQRPIPEPFIWYVAEGLAECALAMAQGSITQDQVDGWREIVHRDIKPSNIFLAEKDAVVYPYYPTPLLGDFGLAFRTTPTDPLNPRAYGVDVGTPGWQAPEHTRYIDQETQDIILGPRLSQQTNVYAIGAVLAGMVRLKAGPLQPIWLGRGTQAETLNSLQLSMDDTNDLHEAYSAELRALINFCLEYNPDDRPTADGLLDAIRDYTREAENDQDRQGDGTPWHNLAQGMKTGSADPGDPRNPHRLDVPLKGDSYQLGMVRKRLPGATSDEDDGPGTPAPPGQGPNTQSHWSNEAEVPES